MDCRVHYRFGNDVIDPQEIVALIGNTLILKDGSKHCVDDATADAVRRAFMPYPPVEPPQPNAPQLSGSNCLREKKS